MHKTDGAHNVAGEFVDEVIGVSPGTIVEEGWLNTVQRELVNVVEGAGLVLDSGEDAQVLAALAMLFRGFMNLTFSTLATTKPNISGRVEVNGTWVPLDDVTPAGSPASPSSNWIYVSEAGAVSFDAANAPAWDVDKRGYYYGDLRAVAWLRVDSGGLYKYHHFLPTDQRAELVFEETLNTGPWNMDFTTTTIEISHKLDQNSIISVSARIKEDDDVGDIWHNIYITDLYGYTGGCVQYWNATSVKLNRITGGFFDSDVFDSEIAPANRGTITIKHKVL